MLFGVYVHVPQCVQVCPYCDFSKYEQSKILPTADYVQTLAQEIALRAPAVGARNFDTLYFGGGTPSLLSAPQILSVISALANAGFSPSKGAEITIEVNPETLTPDLLDGYLGIGINRFSIGAQTFDDHFLKVAGRKHSSADTVRALQLLVNSAVNFSIDVLYSLPGQSLHDVQKDVLTALEFNPNHISPYCLTLSEKHPLMRGRADDDVQIQMMDWIELELEKAGYSHYELSNFSRPGYESRHNLMGWTDQPYWGVGVSSHSYLNFLPGSSKWGARFHNPVGLPQYLKLMASHDKKGPAWSFSASLPPGHFESLEKHQALTDFCHTSMRLKVGLSSQSLTKKFGEAVLELILPRIHRLKDAGWVSTATTAQGESWSLTNSGKHLSNQVFAELTFLKDELPDIDN